MRTAVIFVLFLCCCIGNGAPQNQSCENPEIPLHLREYELSNGQRGVVFNGVHYQYAGEYSRDSSSLVSWEIPDFSHKVYTETKSRNPQTLIIEYDSTVQEFNKHNQGEVIFLELEKLRKATQTSGRKMGDYEGGPLTYMYDPDRNILEGRINFPLDRTLLVVCGLHQQRTGDGEIGQASSVYGVYDFPHMVEDVELLALDEDGTVHLFIFCKYLTIQPGEHAEVTRSFQETIRDAVFVVEITYTITNYGILDISNIVAE